MDFEALWWAYAVALGTPIPGEYVSGTNPLAVLAGKKMSELWVAVTAEYAGSTFSHRAESAGHERDAALRAYNLLLDLAGNQVRRGLVSVLPAQKTLSSNMPLSDREKLAEIARIIDDDAYGGPLIDVIKEVLKR